MTPATCPADRFAAAIRHYEAGRRAEAEALCRVVLGDDPCHTGAMTLLAVVLCLSEQHDSRVEAIDLLRRAHAWRPGDVQVLDILGDALTAEGRLGEAIDAYRTAIRHAPADARLHSKLGIAFNDSGRHGEAIAALRIAVACDPGAARSHFNLGVVLSDTGDHAAAADAYEAAIARCPRDPIAHVRFGAALARCAEGARADAAFETAARLSGADPGARITLAGWYQDVGELDRAFAVLRDVTRRHPDDPRAPLALGNLLLAMQRFADAAVAFKYAITLAPQSVEAHNNLGVACQELGHTADAVAAWCRALALDADHVGSYNNLAVALTRLDDLDAALAMCRHTLAIRPESATALSNLALVLEQQGDTEAAIAILRKAVDKAPTSGPIRFNLAVNLLRSGDLAAGWDEYEWRWRGGVRALVPPDFRQPQWQGDDLAGRTVLIHAEQGFGDTLQFIRYLDRARRMNGRVVLVVPTPLERLLRPLPGVTVLPAGAPLPAFDVHLPLMSLPRVFGTRLDTIPAAVPYLSVDPAAVAAWRQRLAPNAFTVGLVWSGNPDHQYDDQRSIAAESVLAALQVPGVVVHSLQKAVRPADRAVLADRVGAVVDLAPQLADFHDTAAAVTALDLVISVDTAVVHLAGALARPTWTLVPFVPDWRWLTGREDSPWYPTMRLFRQPRRGDWTSVLARLQAALRETAARRGTGAAGTATAA